MSPYKHIKLAHGLTALACALTLLSPLGCTTDQDEPTPGSTSWVQTHTDTSWWLNVFSTAQNDRWVVGGTLSQGAILHYDGATWSKKEPGFDFPLLNWTHGFSANDLVMVGNEGTILRYNGSTFTVESSPSNENLWGVWGASPERIYAVGGSGRPDSKATLLVRENGAWNESTFPELQRPNVFAFFKVWGSADDDVYVVGQRGAVIHWDGTDWSELFVFQPGQEARDLIAVWGTDDGRVAIVGGRNNGVLVLKDGPAREANAWRAIDLAADAYPGLNGVWMRNDKVHAVGNSGQVLRVDYATGAIEQDILLETMWDLHAIHGSADGVLTTVSFNPLALQEADAEGQIFTRGITEMD